MKRFGFEFDRDNQYGKNLIIYDIVDKSTICTCGYYNRKESIKNCPNCGTNTAIEIHTTKAGRNFFTKKALNYLKFNNDEFIVKTDNIEINVNYDVIIENNEPVYKIVEDSLRIKVKECINLRFYYELNKRKKYSLKSEYFINGEVTKLYSYNCPSLFNTLFITDKVRGELSSINIQRHYSLDLWKIYSYYKNAPDLIRNGYINFKGNPAEIKQLNSLYSNEVIGPVFDDLINQYRCLTGNKGKADYYEFEGIYAERVSYNYCRFNPNFVKYMLSLDMEILKAAYNEHKYVTDVLKVLYELKYNTEETNNFLSLALRQRFSFYQLADSNILQTVRILNKYGIEIEKNPKDVRIYTDKLLLLTSFNSYIYSTSSFSIENTLLEFKKLSYYDRVEEIAHFLSKNNYDFFPTLIELGMERSTQNTDIAILLKNGGKVEDCLLIIKNNDIHRIMYKDISYNTEEEINEFLKNIEEESVSYSM